MKGCQLREGYLESGLRTLELENAYLIIKILPEKGGDIYSVQYKPVNHVDVLWKSPWGPSKPGTKTHQGGGDSAQQWLDYYPGGWQVMFPNAGGECTYKGAFQSFHGEANAVPWNYQVLMNNGNELSVLLHTHLTRSPFKIERKLTILRDESMLKIHDKVINQGEEEMDYVWGQHIAYGAPFLSEDCTIHVPAEYITSEQHGDIPHYRLISGEKYKWPMVQTTSGENIDFSKIPPENTRATDLAYLTGLKDGWYAIRNHKMDLTVGVGWDVEVLPHVWLWQEFRGLFGHPFYGRCYVMGMEPCSTPISAGLVESINQKLSSRLQPGQSQELELSMVLFQGQKNIRKITPKGEIVS